MSDDKPHDPRNPTRSYPSIPEPSPADGAAGRATRLEATVPPDWTPAQPDVPPQLRGGDATRLETSPVPQPPQARRTQLEGAIPSEKPPPPEVQSPMPPTSSRATRLEGASQSSEFPPNAPVPAHYRPPSPPPLGPRATRLEPSPGMQAPGAPPRRYTSLQQATPPPTGMAPQAPAGMVPQVPVDSRPMVAALAATGYGVSGAVFPLRAGKNLIGAGPGCEITLSADSEVSGEHALILQRDQSFYLSDRMSTNGTWINGESLDPTQNAVLLRDKDRIRCGQTDLVLLLFESPATEVPEENQLKEDR